MWTVKLFCLKRGDIGSRTGTCVNWGGPIVLVPCLHQGNIYIKRKLRIWRDQKCIPLLGRKTSPTCVGRQTTQSQGSQYRPGNGNLRKLGWTYRHGTVFAPKQCLYIKRKLLVWRDRKCIPLLGAKIPLTCAGRQTSPSQRSWYRAENANLRKLGWTYRYVIVFATRPNLFQKHDKDLERPEMYSPSRCKTPCYLCGPSNYPASRESV